MDTFVGENIITEIICTSALNKLKKIAIVQEQIETIFRHQVSSDKKVKNAYLLVHSEKLGIDINIAEGKTGEIQANPKQANHLASVGK